MLDVGCGEGYGSYLLSNFAELIAVDHDINLKKVWNKYTKSKKIEFILGEATMLPFRDRSFDYVIAFQVIEHIADDKGFVKEVFRILKDGGKFFITTPNRSLRLKPGQKPWFPYHVREYDYSQLNDILQHYFSEVKIFGIKGDEEVQKIELRRIKRIQKLLSIDFLGFRKIIPHKILRKFLRLGKRKDKNQFYKYCISNYSISEDLDNALDLFGICKK